MPRFGKRIVIAIILAQLIALPILLIASKRQQETRSRAATGEVLQPQDSSEDVNFSQNGNSAFSPDLSSSFESASEEPVITETLSVRTTSQATPANPGLKKQVYTYLPYWEVNEDADTYLQYKYMTHLIYHGISLRKNGVINKSNGPWNVWKGERMGKIVQNARASGAKVIPNIVLFNGANSSGLSDFLNSQDARKKGVTQIMNFLKTSPQPVDGAAIDFEYPNSSQRNELVSFIKDLRREMKAYNSKWELIIAISGYSYAGGGFDLPALNPFIDGFFVMSYHLKNPKTAEKAGSTNPIGSLNTLSENYLKKIPGEKVVLGFPLYLAEWKTLDDSLRATKKPGTGGGKTTTENDCGVSGSTCTRLAQRFAKTYGKKYDSRDKAAYYSFYTCSGKKGWRQVYFDDEQAFTDKFAIVNKKKLGGVGFWAQNYDKGYLDTWKAIYNQFADKTRLSAPTKKPGFDVPAPIPSNGCTPPGISGTPTPTPTFPPGTTVVNLTVGLDGIGVTSRIPLGGNKNPNNRNRSLEVKIYKASDNSLVFSNNQVFSFNSSTNRFDTNITLPSSFGTGIYNIYALGNPFLTARYPGSVTITKNQTTVLNSDNFNLITGDVNKTEQSKNLLNILDYNVIISCSVFVSDQSNCNLNPDYKKNSDLNDDGIVNQNDITLFIKEMSNQSGDNLPGD